MPKVIDVHIDIVANHWGYFYFQLCPHNDHHSAPAHECFEQYRLKYDDILTFNYCATPNKIY